MKIFLKFLLVTFIWLLIAAVIIGGSIMADALDTGITIFTVIFIGWLAFLLIRKVVITYQAKKKVESLTNVESGDKKKWDFNFSLSKSTLHSNFLGMTKLLRGSHLKVHGDPLYVLPWYLTLGQSSSGKSDLLNEANLPSPTIDKSNFQTTAGSINWALYNQGIVIDTPGSYLDGKNSGSNNNAEWLELLSILKKYRVKEPINGLVVTISMEELLAENSQKLIDMGIDVRRNIEQLMQVLHVQVPVYVVVTHLDKFPGMEQWINSLSKEQLDAPMGEVNNDQESSANFVRNTVANVAERLKQLMLLSIKDQKVTSDLLLLPTKFEQIERNLTTYTENLFQTNPYQKTPFFRAIYFVGHQHVEDEFQAKGVFSNRLFTEIIPQERNMVSSLANSEKTAKKQRLGKAFAWNGVFAAVIASLYFAYNTDKETLSTVIDENAGGFEESPELIYNINNLYQFRNMLNDIQQNSWMPWFPSSEQPEFVTKLEGILAERVQARLVDNADQVFSRELANSFTRGADISEEKIVAYISTLVRRINIIDEYLLNNSTDGLSSLPSPFSESDADFFGITEDAAVENLNTLYLESLSLASSKKAIKDEVSSLDKELRKVLLKSNDLAQWLVPWANKVNKGQKIHISDYWVSGTGKMLEDTEVEGAYTLEGKQSIDDFIAQIKATGRYNELLDKILPGFEEEYKKQYLESWALFAKNFYRGNEKLVNRNEWLSIINNLSTGRNLFFNSLNLIEKQIAPYKDDPDLPDWARMVNYYQEMRAFAPDEKVDGGGNKMLTKMALKIVGKAGPLGKALAKSGKKGLKAKKKADKNASGPSVDERQMQLEEAGTLLGNYRESLANFVYNAETRSVSHKAISELFTNPDNPTLGESSLATAYVSVKKLQAIVGKESDDSKAFWSLYMGGISLMQNFMIKESSCQLQDIWENEFLANLEGVPTYKLPNLAFGESGMLWSFLDGQLSPFVSERFGAGYVAKKSSENNYPITNDFLTFAAHAKDSKQANQLTYSVQLDALPTSINLDSKYHVSKTTLELQCAAGASTLVNRNFPSSKQFEWSESCSGVNLTVNVGRFTLEKKYEGEKGFPDFLRDFSTGQKRFTAEDFPNDAKRLRESGISFIDVKYQMQGQMALLNSLKSKDLDIPRKISTCWNRERSLTAAL